MTILALNFEAPTLAPSPYLDGAKILFTFTIIDLRYIGTPREISETKRGKIAALASRSLLDAWSLNSESIEKVLFQIAKEHICSVLSKDGVLPDDIELVANTDTHPGRCPFDLRLIENPAGAAVEVEVTRRIGFV